MWYWTEDDSIISLQYENYNFSFCYLINVLLMESKFIKNANFKIKNPCFTCWDFYIQWIKNAAKFKKLFLCPFWEYFVLFWNTYTNHLQITYAWFHSELNKFFSCLCVNHLNIINIYIICNLNCNKIYDLELKLTLVCDIVDESSISW